MTTKRNKTYRIGLILNLTELAAHLGVSRQTLYNWRERDKHGFPKQVKGIKQNEKLYRVDEVEKYRRSL